MGIQHGDALLAVNGIRFQSGAEFVNLTRQSATFDLQFVHLETVSEDEQYCEAVKQAMVRHIVHETARQALRRPRRLTQQWRRRSSQSESVLHRGWSCGSLTGAAGEGTLTAAWRAEEEDAAPYDVEDDSHEEGNEAEPLELQGGALHRNLHALLEVSVNPGARDDDEHDDLTSQQREELRKTEERRLQLQRERELQQESVRRAAKESLDQLQQTGAKHLAHSQRAAAARNDLQRTGAWRRQYLLAQVAAQHQLTLLGTSMKISLISERRETEEKLTSVGLPGFPRLGERIMNQESQADNAVVLRHVVPESAIPAPSGSSDMSTKSTARARDTKRQDNGANGPSTTPLDVTKAALQNAGALQDSVAGSLKAAATTSAKLDRLMGGDAEESAGKTQQLARLAVDRLYHKLSQQQRRNKQLVSALGRAKKRQAKEKASRSPC